MYHVTSTGAAFVETIQKKRILIKNRKNRVEATSARDHDSEKFIKYELPVEELDNSVIL